MQTVRLENTDRQLIKEIQIPEHGEPDAIVLPTGNVFVRRPPAITEPLTKNNPEVYVEASTLHLSRETDAPFDRVTQGTRTEIPERIAPNDLPSVTEARTIVDQTIKNL